MHMTIHKKERKKKLEKKKLIAFAHLPPTTAILPYHIMQLLLALAACVAAHACLAAHLSLNLSYPVIELARGSPPRAATYAATLQVQLCRRLLLAPDSRCFPVFTAPAPANASAVIALSVAAATDAASSAPEGYTLAAIGSGISIAGNDERGLLFGVGALLKEASISAVRTFTAGAPQRWISLDASFLPLVSAPAYPMRMHQLGYRALNNAYDAMDLPATAAHITELALFGANAVEFTVQNDMIDGPYEDSPLFHADPPSWLAAMSAHADTLGVGVGIW